MTLVDVGISRFRTAREQINGFANKQDDETINIGGFTAGVRIEESIILESEVPDSPLENGSVASDHMINKPVVISITGVIGDIDLKPVPVVDEAIRVNQNIGSISVLIPPRTQNQISTINGLAVSVYDIAKRVDGLVSAGEQVFSIYKPNQSQPAFKQFFIAINQLRAAKALIDIETSFGIYKNMAIISTSLPRSIGQQRDLTYSIRAKQLTFAETIFSQVKALKKNPGTGLQGQAGDLVDKGLNSGKDVQESVLFKVANIY